MNRDEHVAWTKARALEELDNDPHGGGGNNAIASLISDLRLHPDTAGHAAIVLTVLLAADGHLDNPSAMREHIEGVW